ncbi:hypothetical protein SK128_013796 [Halocaridina rubra]|uniref:Uncharacterized protein n=1 Tax=Halocaridina rubra TaxID=373956 RepID=A0AAN8XLP3_HALRR
MVRALIEVIIENIARHGTGVLVGDLPKTMVNARHLEFSLMVVATVFVSVGCGIVKRKEEGIKNMALKEK